MALPGENSSVLTMYAQPPHPILVGRRAEVGTCEVKAQGIIEERVGEA